MIDRGHVEALIADVKKRLAQARAEEEELYLDVDRPKTQFAGHLNGLTPETWENRRDKLTNKYYKVSQLERTLEDLERTLNWRSNQ